MSLFRTLQLCAVLGTCVGCQSAKPSSTPAPGGNKAALAISARVVPQRLPRVEQTLRPVAFQEVVQPSADIDSDLVFANSAELSLEQFIQEVLRRNPNLQSMAAAWQAASERYPQVVSLEDPMFMAMMAPASVGSSDVETGYVLEGAQKVPWFGKRALRGSAAQAEATAVGQELRDASVRLTEAAQIAFYEYYLVRQQHKLSRDNQSVMREFRESAQTRYRANQVTQRDVIQADIELSQLDRRLIELNRMHTVAVARVNVLLRRPPDAHLPPPPSRLDGSPRSIDLQSLQGIAAAQRPDLAAIAARVNAEQAAVALACKDYYPDGEFFGRYDTFWQPASTQGDLRGQVGVRMNVPLYRGRLDAASREASFRLSQRRAEYDQKLLDVQYEVQAAFAEFEESRESLELYSEKLLPIAEQNVAAARVNYDVGKDTFLDLAIAQRQLIDLREKQQEALATYHRRLAALARSVGGSIPSLNGSGGN